MSELYFWASKIIAVGLEPRVTLPALAVLGLALVSLNWLPRLGKWALGIGVWGYMVLSVVPVGHWALGALEDRFPVVHDLPAQVDGIIVLGGSTDPIMSASRGQVSLDRTAERLTAFVSLARLYPEAQLLFTGGSGQVLRQDVSEASVSKTLLVDLGVDLDRVLFEGKSRNTYENAVYAYDLAKPQDGQVWMLVTTASHMPRAMGAFRKAGWDVLAYPVDFETLNAEERGRAPKMIGDFDALSFALHEWVGLVVYKFRGWIDDFFPSPEPY